LLYVLTIILIYQNEEDQSLKEKLELCVERLSDNEAGLRDNALEMIRVEVIGATSSMSSVPKPLKFMTPLYSKLTETYDKHSSEDRFKVSKGYFIMGFSLYGLEITC